MAPRRLPALAAAALVAGCAGAPKRPASPLPPPARESRAGTRDPGAGPAIAPPPPAPREAAQAAAPPPRPGSRDAAISKALAAARQWVGREGAPDGCAALVRHAYGAAGHPLPPDARDAAALLELARERRVLRRGAPAAGDLVFFADRPGGAAEHVGIVERVQAGGTATVLHRTSRGVARVRVTTAMPWTARASDGRLLNDVLLVGAGRVPAGRLVVGFATLL